MKRYKVNLFIDVRGFRQVDVFAESVEHAAKVAVERFSSKPKYAGRKFTATWVCELIPKPGNEWEAKSYRRGKVFIVGSPPAMRETSGPKQKDHNVFLTSVRFMKT